MDSPYMICARSNPIAPAGRQRGQVVRPTRLLRPCTAPSTTCESMRCHPCGLSRPGARIENIDWPCYILTRIKPWAWFCHEFVMASGIFDVIMLTSYDILRLRTYGDFSALHLEGSCVSSMCSIPGRAYLLLARTLRQVSLLIYISPPTPAHALMSYSISGHSVHVSRLARDVSG